MLRGKENNAGDAKVWTVDDDTTLWDQLQSEVPAPKLAKSPKVAALVAKLSASADEIVARFGELLDPLGPARYRLDEAVRAKSRARKGLTKPKKKKSRVATPEPPRVTPRREDLLDALLNGPPTGSEVFVRWQGAPGPERDGYWRATVERSSDGKLWLVGHDFDPAFGEPMPFDPVQDSWRMAPRAAPRTTPRPPPPPPRPAPPPAPRVRLPAPAPPPSPPSMAEKAAVLHAIAQLDRKATQKDVRRMAEFALGQRKVPHAKKAEIKELCRKEVTRLEEAEESRKASGRRTPTTGPHARRPRRSARREPKARGTRGHRHRDRR